MTRDEFIEKNCCLCGSQRCYRDDESISTCGRYNGEIPGIEKKESLQEMLSRLNSNKDIEKLTKIITTLNKKEKEEIKRLTYILFGVKYTKGEIPVIPTDLIIDCAIEKTNMIIETKDIKISLPLLDYWEVLEL